MEIEIKNHTKRTKQEQVFEILDKRGYILDNQAADIFGEGKLYCVSEHERIWKRLRADEEFFADKKIIEKKKVYRKHLVRAEKQPTGQYYQVGKEFYNQTRLQDKNT